MKSDKILAAAILWGLFSGSLYASDDEITLIPSLAFQSKSLTFDQNYSGFENNTAEFSVTMPIVNLSFTGVYKKFFASVKFEKSLSSTPTATTETDRSLLNQSNLIALEGSDVNANRQDMSITIGYNPWKKLNIFIGYLDGETKLEPYPFCADFGSCTRLNRAFQQFAIQDALNNDHPTYRQAYSESGLFLGASYGFSVSDLGVLSVSLAYAKMDGRYSDNANDPGFNDVNDGFRYFWPPNNNNLTTTTFVAFDYSGDTTGTSLGLTWTGSLGDRYAYFIDARRQSYSMKGEDDTGLLSGISLKTEETMLGASLGIQAYY